MSEGLLKKSKGENKVIVLGEGAQVELYPWPQELLEMLPSIADVIETSKLHEYVKVKVPKQGLVNQPRKTLCYGHAYAYSGQTHPMEPETPPFIQKLYDVTNAMFNVQTNMCLLNIYSTGYHSISAHSDAEKQMGELTDVYCWSIGAQRKAIFRNKKTFEKFTIEIPEGLYVMRGPNFQRDFTHEFPKAHHDAFQKQFAPLCPLDGVSSLEKADWLFEHKEEILEKLRGTKFQEWCRPRISWTLRQFKIK
jgi:alkylated DNA repair dioxygenase AlkB